MIKVHNKIYTFNYMGRRLWENVVTKNTFKEIRKQFYITIDEIHDMVKIILQELTGRFHLYSENGIIGYQDFTYLTNYITEKLQRKFIISKPRLRKIVKFAMEEAIEILPTASSKPITDNLPNFNL